VVATVLLFGLAVVLALGPTDNLAKLALGLGAAWGLGWHLAWQLIRLDIDDAEGCLRLFRSNRDAGLIPVAFLALATAL
jgi:4-hydroxybenzoate polyprenyltransferase